ncbi:L7Ae/L30e/S12e/Gadd45 family ribosomal protein [Levilactobacillus bambusae]|uniref:Ribosomal protein eL8/eL30/eS12/Gadd45 domain-containing protein n=1 Tax=Levilactobacillus bambusae TaxID=2024736 RepID=A0A2V1N0J3_9LACO|nr:ribosomal L7Ae/L30e/S12e/Gadd45 family protein [Levilactobacillus bambusae]PWG00734.1 hypothetical protein DCM90_00735 [Levilactobacillus bambusae]
MTNQEKAQQLLGLVRRAGQLTTGEQFTLASIRDRSAKLVILANDASDNTLKQFRDKTASYQISLDETFTKADLSAAIGMKRTVVAIKDAGFADKLKALLS